MRETIKTLSIFHFHFTDRERYFKSLALPVIDHHKLNERVYWLKIMLTLIEEYSLNK
jgi:hypothetical protein